MVVGGKLKGFLCSIAQLLDMNVAESGVGIQKLDILPGQGTLPQPSAFPPSSEAIIKRHCTLITRKTIAYHGEL